MKILKTVLWIFLALILLNISLSHEDEFGEANSFHFFHMGKLTFPIWTYWAEIIEHFAIVLTILVGLFILYLKSNKGKKRIFGLFELSFAIILTAEIFTLLHHFLIFPFGIFNAIFHHGLLFIGILLLVIVFVKNKGKGK